MPSRMNPATTPKTMKHENVIAIDPDKEKSGVAFLKVKTRP